ncbi:MULTISPECIES: hypothetical protein [unclassified Paenibacillus]|uniref:Uncharacterized protein n=1 Tax=Paenibacillus provencensis TaxID=441151 RepID=A0ABW3PUA4_9BACL|nr:MULTISPECIES: hypothetical protein [unclassified Paenibacillus]MCM3127770.1 hypothetical protein [Paenibacillus sp. MER 78]SFS38169.1 hypothetical protein SAMN04488601_101193 [Paenibacillus sp. 453mf]
MDKPLITLSIEEFGFALASLGADDVAAGLMKPMYGELKENEWELVLRAASHSLLSKGLITRMEENEIEFVPELLDMLVHFAKSRSMLRGYTDWDGQEKVLTIHKGTESGDPYLYHLSIDQRIHLFTWTEPSEWEEEIYRLYVGQNRKFPSENATSFQLPESGWNQLIENPSEEQVERLLKEWAIQDSQHEVIRSWCSEFQASGRSLDNLSIMNYSEEELPAAEKILLLLHTNNYFWSIYDTQLDKDKEALITVERSGENNFRHQLQQMIEQFNS